MKMYIYYEYKYSKIPMTYGEGLQNKGEKMNKTDFSEGGIIDHIFSVFQEVHDHNVCSANNFWEEVRKNWHGC